VNRTRAGAAAAGRHAIDERLLEEAAAAQPCIRAIGAGGRQVHFTSRARRFEQAVGDIPAILGSIGCASCQTDSRPGASVTPGFPVGAAVRFEVQQAARCFAAPGAPELRLDYCTGICGRHTPYHSQSQLCISNTGIGLALVANAREWREPFSRWRRTESD
jgi:hypothetical protein